MSTYMRMISWKPLNSLFQSILVDESDHENCTCVALAALVYQSLS